jgi:rod shape-determining protein MreB
MSRFKKIMAQAEWLRRLEPKTILLDFGSAQVRAWSHGRLFWHQPSWVVMHPGTQAVVMVGDQAGKSLGKVPATLSLVQPVKRATLAEPTAAEGYLQQCLAQVRTRQAWWQQLLGPTLVVAVPASCTPLDQKIWSETCLAAGAGKVVFVSKAQALAARLQRRPQIESGLCVVDVGADTTEVIFYWGDQPLVHQTLPLGGSDYTREVIKQVRQIWSCEVGWQTAEKVKQLLGQPGQARLSLRAKQLTTGLPSTITIEVQPIQAALEQLTSELIAFLKQTLSEVPTELSASALDNGIFLTGQASQMAGLADQLSRLLKTQVIRSASPDRDIIMGLAQLWEKPA